MERPMAVDLIKNALAQVLDQGTGGLTEQTPLFDGLALDSMGVVELLIIVEEMAGICVQVDELEYEAFETIGTLADFLLRIEKIA